MSIFDFQKALGNILTKKGNISTLWLLGYSWFTKQNGEEMGFD